MLNRAWAYGQKIFGLDALLAGLPDTRQKPQIPAAVFPRALLMLWLCRVPSLHALEQFGRKGAGRKLLHHPMPGADQLANMSEHLDLDSLRRSLGGRHKRLVRNKVLCAFRGHRLAIVDGHEINASYRRCCDQCQQREMTVGKETRIQYYHRAVILQLAGPGFQLLLDMELFGAHEDEGTAAIRLIERVIKNHPRAFDILLGDGLYPQARIFTLLRQHGKHVIAVLKDERRNVLTDARALFSPTPDMTVKRGKVSCQLWDIQHLTSWESYPDEVRIVRSVETRNVRQRQGKTWLEFTQISEWVWVTTLSADEVSAETIMIFGHERWRIENEGFNELSNQWHADHIFHHHTTSIVGLWLLLFIAHALFHSFLRNLKPCIRKHVPVVQWARLMLAEFLAPLLSSA